MTTPVGSRRSQSTRSAAPSQNNNIKISNKGVPPSVGAPFSLVSELLGQLRDDLEQVADEAEVGDLKDRGFLVLVDGDDQLRILHARDVLDRARNADRDIDFGA